MNTEAIYNDWSVLPGESKEAWLERLNVNAENARIKTENEQMYQQQLAAQKKARKDEADFWADVSHRQNQIIKEGIAEFIAKRDNPPPPPPKTVGAAFKSLWTAIFY